MKVVVGGKDDIVRGCGAVRGVRGSSGALLGGVATRFEE